ncbi:MAG: UvrD-helicase domain-containing protein [Phycisphaerales bacterium]|jgi:ATP-dependent exoDNAse (exonuclease V) beta subunit|nr:UvrD-helicase domain-containing protein [Phycisphaerales bacterium]
MSDFQDCVVIEALAGAGKTYKLSHRYLELIQMGADPNSVLATTFSRKAAGEIRDSIIEHAAKAVLDDASRKELCDCIPNLKRLNKEEQKTECSDLLRNIIFDLHNLQISTIDSFFVRTAKLFGDEMGFPPQWSILGEIQERQILQEVVRDMFDGQNAKKMAEAIRLAEDSSVVPLLKTVNSIRKFAYDLIRQTGRDAWDWGNPLDTLSKAELRKAIDAFASETSSVKTQLNSIPKDVERAEKCDWRNFLKKGLPAGVFNGTENYYKDPIEQHLVQALRPIVDHACAIIVNRVFAKNKGIFELMELFNKSWSEIKHKNGLYLFEDITHYLILIFKHVGLQELAYRLDSKIDHLLIDEFQDTSIPQWEIMEEIVDEIHCNSGRSLFFVGDPKQSLYGFRGGEPQLLRSLPKKLGLVEPERLPTSYRCSKPVLDLVNSVFMNAEQSQLLSDYSLEGVEEWKSSFSKHISAHEDRQGFAAVYTTDVDEDRKPKLEYAVEKVAEIVRDLHSKNKDLSIGVLVRKNTGQQIQRIVHALKSHPTNPVMASEHKGNPLTDSPPVTVVLSALLLADHPGDTASLFHVSTSPLGASLGLDVTWNRNDAFALSNSLREQLLKKGYANVVCDLSKPLFAGASKRDKMRLWQLIELAESYSKESTLRASDFVDYVKKMPVADPATSNVQVMTVHASKGLGFDAVVVCDLNSRLWRDPKVLTLREDEGKPPTKVSVCENESFNDAIQDQEEMWAQCKSVHVQEALSLLYVAITRAKYAVHLVIPPRPENKSAKKYTAPTSKVVDRFLRQVLEIDEHLEPNKIVWQSDLNNEKWHETASTTSIEDKTSDRNTLVWGTIKNNSRAIATASPSSLEGGGKTKVSERFKGGTNTAFDWGTVVHKWFEDIEWFDGNVPTIEDLISSAPSEEGGRLGNDKLILAAQTCISALQEESLQHLLCKPEGNVVVYREQDFVLRIDKGTGFSEVVINEPTDIRGTIDRLVVHKDTSGNVVRAEVIDWKTDKLDDGKTVDDLVSNYAPQLASYRLAAARLLDIDISSVTAILALISEKKILDITPKASCTVKTAK